MMGAGRGWGLGAVCAACVVCVQAVGCRRPTLDSVVQDLVEERGLSVQDCGDIEVQPLCDDSMERPETECFAQGVDACQPVRLDVTTYTIEGDPLHAAYVVVPDQRGCHVEYFLDSRDDSFGEAGIAHHSCLVVKVGQGCDPVSVNGCLPA